MASLVLIGIIVVMILVLLVQLFRNKPVKKLLLSYVLILGSYHLYVVNTCGPNSTDVKVMTPQAEVITNYVLKNGVPKSMQEIPNLPYQWDRCERTSKNVEWCYFHVNGNSYGSELDFFAGSYIYMKTYNKKSETGVLSGLKKQSNGIWFMRKDLTPYSTKHDGVCNPMRM